MYYSTLYSFLLIFLFSCAEPDLEKRYDPATQLSTQEQDSLTYSIIRYMAKLPAQATHLNKFDVKFDSAYQLLAGRHKLIGLSKDKEELYLMYIRHAPSINEKFVAIGGRLKKENDTIVSYEEIFRTWKKEREKLKPLAYQLFHEMVEGKDLSRYYPENSGDEYIIEFPSKDVYFDSNERVWRSRLPNFNLNEPEYP